MPILIVWNMPNISRPINWSGPSTEFLENFGINKMTVYI